MLKTILGISDVSSDIKNQYKEEVLKKINFLNASRGLFILFTGIVFEIVLVFFYDIPNIVENGWTGDFGVYYLSLHTIIFFLSLLGVIRSHRYLKNKPFKLFKSVPFEYLAIIVAFVFLTSMAIINSMDQRYADNITLYSVYALIIGSVILLEPKYMFGVLLTSHVFFVVGMITFQQDPRILGLNLTNGTIVILCSFVISYIFYVNFYEIHLKSILLEKTTKELEALSNTDYLTKLSNRRYFYQYITNGDFKKHLHGRIIFVLFDLDSFKQINDTYGHVVGDEILVYFSELLTSRLQSYELSVRWGGEEFLLVLQGKTDEGAYAYTKYILEECRNAYSATLSHKIKLSASAGISTIEEFSEKEVDPALSKADYAMYQAKSRGKNQIAFWENEKSI